MISRRVFLAGSATAVGAVSALAACSTTASPGTGTPSPGGGLIALGDVPVGGAAAAVTASGARIVVARPEAGKVVAFSAVCTHAGCTVAAEGGQLICPCHGSVFEAATGGVVRGPATSPLPSVAVTVKDGEVVEA